MFQPILGEKGPNRKIRMVSNIVVVALGGLGGWDEQLRLVSMAWVAYGRVEQTGASAPSAGDLVGQGDLEGNGALDAFGVPGGNGFVQSFDAIDGVGVDGSPEHIEEIGGGDVWIGMVKERRVVLDVVSVQDLGIGRYVFDGMCQLGVADEFDPGGLGVGYEGG